MLSQHTQIIPIVALLLLSAWLAEVRYNIVNERLSSGDFDNLVNDEAFRTSYINKLIPDKSAQAHIFNLQKSFNENIFAVEDPMIQYTNVIIVKDLIVKDKNGLQSLKCFYIKKILLMSIVCSTQDIKYIKHVKDKVTKRTLINEIWLRNLRVVSLCFFFDIMNTRIRNFNVNINDNDKHENQVFNALFENYIPEMITNMNKDELVVVSGYIPQLITVIDKKEDDETMGVIDKFNKMTNSQTFTYTVDIKNIPVSSIDEFKHKLFFKPKKCSSDITDAVTIHNPFHSDTVQIRIGSELNEKPSVPIEMLDDNEPDKSLIGIIELLKFII